MIRFSLASPRFAAVGVSSSVVLGVMFPQPRMCPRVGFVQFLPSAGSVHYDHTTTPTLASARLARVTIRILIKITELKYLSYRATALGASLVPQPSLAHVAASQAAARPDLMLSSLVVLRVCPEVWKLKLTCTCEIYFNTFFPRRFCSGLHAPHYIATVLCYIYASKGRYSTCTASEAWPRETFREP